MRPHLLEIVDGGKESPYNDVEYRLELAPQRKQSKPFQEVEKPMKKLYRKMKMGERGFTLIELLVVVAILGILATLAIPRITLALDDAKNNKSKSDLKIIEGALERYYFDKGSYPDNLNALKGTYVKSSYNFTNGYGKIFYYAVSTDKKHFFLGDPANNDNLDAADTSNAGTYNAGPPATVSGNGVGDNTPISNWTTYVTD